MAGSYADVENISRAVGAVGGGGGGASLVGGNGRPELVWFGCGDWTFEENVVELKRSADVVWSDEPDEEADDSGVDDPNRPPRNAILLH